MKSIIYLHLLELIPKIVLLIRIINKEIIAEPVQNSEKSLASIAFEEAMIVLAVVQCYLSTT